MKHQIIQDKRYFEITDNQFVVSVCDYLNISTRYLFPGTITEKDGTTKTVPCFVFADKGIGTLGDYLFPNNGPHCRFRAVYRNGNPLDCRRSNLTHVENTTENPYPELKLNPAAFSVLKRLSPGELEHMHNLTEPMELVLEPTPAEELVRLQEAVDRRNALTAWESR